VAPGRQREKRKQADDPVSDPTVPDTVVAAASRLSSATLHEAAGRRGALPCTLKPLTREMRLCGRALPVRCPAGDNLWLHHALAAATPGDVLVVDTGAGVEFGYWGEIMATAAMVRGVAGLIITGGVRDSVALIALGLPTFSATICIRATLKERAGDGAVGEPVRIGEIVVRRGDLAFGDADGLVVLNQAHAARTVQKAARRDADELLILDKVRAGALTLDVYDF
jgi:4-hydroxy-4-methyl-2-oxoglutarate aldolase